MKAIFVAIATIGLAGCTTYTATSALAGENEDWISTMGAGAQTCAGFGKMYAENPARFEGLFFQWAQGFLSGLNGPALYLSEYGYPKADLSTISTDSQMAWLRDYCADNPLRSYMSAVLDLYGELIAKMNSKPTE